MLAVAAAKAESLDDMRRLGGLLALTLEEEMEMHRRTCAAFGITSDELERTEPGLVTSAYTSYLLRTCYDGSMTDILAVLLPCAAGYVEIAQRLRERGLPDVEHYREWIETYTDPSMVELVEWLSERVDAMGAEASEAARVRWLDRYRTSARYELLFFDMAWRRETWPSIVPA